MLQQNLGTGINFLLNKIYKLHILGPFNTEVAITISLDRPQNAAEQHSHCS